MRYTERDGQGRQGGREDVDEYEEKCVHRAAGAGHAAVGAAKAERAVCAGTEYDPAGGQHAAGGLHHVPAQGEKEGGRHAHLRVRAVLYRGSCGGDQEFRGISGKKKRGGRLAKAP